MRGKQADSRDLRNRTNLVFVSFRNIVKYPRLPPTAAAAAAEQQSYHPQDLNITFQAISSVSRSSDTTRALNMQAIKCVVVGDG